MDSAAKGLVFRFVLAVFMGLGFAGCSDYIAPAAKDDSINFVCTLPEPFSKTAMTGDQAAFTTGDQVGIFETLTAKSNVLYTYGSPAWTTAAPMYWKDYTSFHQFYAYYPYNATGNGLSVSVPVLSTQAISGVPDPKSDMLVASLNQKRSAAVALNFTHAFALLKFNISFASGLLGVVLPGRMILYGGNLAASSTGPYGIFNSVNTLSKISYNVATKALTYSPNDITVFQQSLSVNMPTLTGTTTFYVLALPGTYNNPAPYAQFTLKLILGGLELYSPNQSLGVTTLNANTRYEYNVYIVRNILSKGADESPVKIYITQVDYKHFNY